jgi:capsular exopolysaccharide synthesis family protein
MALYSRAETQRAVESGSISESLVAVLEPFGDVAEAYRYVRANLLYNLAEASSRVIVVTSPGPAEGKSNVCANLGVVLAQAGENTLVLDCNLRRPSIHKIFGLRNTHGIFDVLFAEYKLEESYQEPYPTLGLKVLTVGPLPPNPAEVLSSQRFSELLAGVREQFDYVLVDSSPTNLVSDVTAVAAQADGVLLVLDAQKTRKGDARGAVRSLTAVGANIIGTVMNNAKRRQDSYH